MEIIKSKADFETNIERAFDEIDGDWRDYRGLVILGTHMPQDVDLKLEKIKWARENNVPFLGICFGFQLSVIEYARSVLGLKEADTQELNPDTKVPIIEKMPELRVGQKQVILYGKFTLQSFWHNYKMNLKYLPLFDRDWIFSVNQDEEVVDTLILKHHPHYVCVQWHPEYQSSKDSPHIILKDFLEQAKLWTKNSNGVAGRPLH